MAVAMPSDPLPPAPPLWSGSVSFLALSYAGIRTVTVIADPGAVPDLPVLAAALQEQLDVPGGVSGRGANPV